MLNSIGSSCVSIISEKNGIFVNPKGQLSSGFLGPYAYHMLNKCLDDCLGMSYNKGIVSITI